jgi:uncharacterized protein (TIRG00374 family)
MAVDEAGVPRGTASGPGRRRLVRRVLSAGVSVAVVFAVFWYFLPQYTNVSDIWRYIREMSWAEVALLSLAAVWNLATYGLVMVSTMPGLTYPQAMVVTESSTAVSNTVPGGGAVGIAMSYSMYSSWGFSKSRSTVSLLVAGIWNNFAKLGMPILALALLALQQSPSTGRIVGGAAGIFALGGAVTLFALLLRSDAWADRIGAGLERAVSRVLRTVGRPPVSGWGHAVRTFRRRTVGLVSARWRSLTVTTVVSHVSLFAVLLVALRAVGVPENDVGWAEALVVFTFARLVTAIPVTPGGVGIVEVALITGMSAAGGVRAQVAAAVLLFRALTYVLPVPLGVLTYAFWRRNRSWRREPGTAPRPPGLQLEQVP